MEKGSSLRSQSARDSFIVALLLALSFSVIAVSLGRSFFARGVDEGYYLRYASYINAKGFLGCRDLFSSYLNRPQDWVFPNPLRIGYIFIAAFFVKIFGSSFFSLVYLSVISFYVFLCFAFRFLKKHFSRDVALLTVALLAFSPLNMAMARRALTDALANLCTVSAVFLYFEVLREKRPYKTILFIFVYTLAILVKENTVLLSVFFLLYLLIRRVLFDKPVTINDVLSATVFPFLFVCITYLVCAGGIKPVTDTVKIIIASPENNRYAILFGSGPWFRYLIDFIMLSPIVSLLAIGYCGHLLFGAKPREETAYFLALSLTMVFLFSFFTKNVRYLIFLELPLCLFAASALYEFTRHFKRRAFILTVVVLFLMFYEYQSFFRLFLEGGIYDPVSFLILRSKGIIP